jgi:cellulose biosynthesis protein BcsQ
MNRNVKALGAAIDALYNRQLNSQQREHAFATLVASESAETIMAVAKYLKQDPNSLLSEWSEETITRYFELTIVMLLATESEDDQLTLLSDLEKQLFRALESDELKKARQGGRALLESLILAIEDVHRKTCQQVLELLAKLSNAPPEGVIPPSRQEEWATAAKHTPDKVTREDQVVLRELLEVGLYREVMSFLQQREDLSGTRKSEESLTQLIKPIVSFSSRKGGVGKSMLVFATAAWYLKEHPAARICIVDLDLSGPVWQYLLFPERDKPSHFLNDLLRVDQGNQKGEFEFPSDLSTAAVEPLLEESTIKVEGKSLLLLSVADLPRTSRYLSIAVANNSEACFLFLTELFSALQPLVDLIIIDNAPGLGSLPLLSHVLASSVPFGCSAVVSTPALPDLRGSIIELSDLYVLDRESVMVNRPPLWIVNKADAKAQEFLSGKHKIVDVANQVEAYNAILPLRPLIYRAVSPASNQFHGLALPLDLSLLTFSNINNGGIPPLQDALKSFLQTEFFQAFIGTVGEAMLPLLSANADERPLLT